MGGSRVAGQHSMWPQAKDGLRCPQEGTVYRRSERRVQEVASRWPAGTCSETVSVPRHGAQGGGSQPVPDSFIPTLTLAELQCLSEVLLLKAPIYMSQKLMPEGPGSEHRPGCRGAWDWKHRGWPNSSDDGKLPVCIPALPNLDYRAVDPSPCTQAPTQESLAGSTVRSGQVRGNQGPPRDPCLCSQLGRHAPAERRCPHTGSTPHECPATSGNLAEF